MTSFANIPTLMDYYKFKAYTLSKMKKYSSWCTISILFSHLRTTKLLWKCCWIHWSSKSQESSCSSYLSCKKRKGKKEYAYFWLCTHWSKEGHEDRNKEKIWKKGNLSRGMLFRQVIWYTAAKARLLTATKYTLWKWGHSEWAKHILKMLSAL